MDSADVIVLDSSEDEQENSSANHKYEDPKYRIEKRKLSDSLEQSQIKKLKRIRPITLSENVVISTSKNPIFEENIPNEVENEKYVTEKEECSNSNNTTELNKINTHKQHKTEINTYFASLLQACRKADQSSDMELLINKKLIRYYESVHPDFVNSKSFRKNVELVTNEINSNPGLVYLKITGIIEELKIRRKSNNCVIANEDVTTTGNERRDNQIKRLNKALYILKRKIAKLEEAEVDFEEDNNSSYLAVERYKKRACEIYEKICDITGESKHAHRSVRKPISFQGTAYPEFNKAIQTFVNRTNTFPDFVDVLKCLEYCNKQYEFKLKSDEMKKIAEDAFIKVGKQLQNRRQADLYETVTYFIGTEKDPAFEDNKLQSKLIENKQFHSRISAIIDKFAEVQERSKDSSAEDDTDDKISEIKNETKVTTKTNGVEHIDEINLDNNNHDATSEKEVNCVVDSIEKIENDNDIVILDDDDLFTTNS